MTETIDDYPEGMERLVYNHALSKRALIELLGIHSRRLNTMIEKMQNDGIDVRTFVRNNGHHLYTHDDVLTILNYVEEHYPDHVIPLGVRRYQSLYNPIVLTIANQKGRVGKTTTAHNLATLFATDLVVRKRVLAIDFDPIGTMTDSMIYGANETDVSLTFTDILISEFKPDSAATKYMQLLMDEADWTFEQIVLASAYNTHLANLDVIPATFNDFKLRDIYAGCNDEERKRLSDKFQCMLDILKTEYDIVLFDTGSYCSSDNFLLFENTDAMLIPIVPNEIDFDSTAKFLEIVSRRMSKSETLKWAQLAIVNEDVNSPTVQVISAKITQTAGTHLLPAHISKREAYIAASSINRSILDIHAQEGHCSPKKLKEAQVELKNFGATLSRSLFPTFAK